MPLSDTTPQVVLISDESSAIALAVSGAIPAGTPGILMAGVTNNTASFLKLDANGNLFITGSVTAAFSTTQTITGSVGITGIPTVTGSFFILNQTQTNPAWITGSVTSQVSVTATNPSIGLTGSAVPLSASYIAGIDSSGLLRGLRTDIDGSLIVTADRYTLTDFGQIRTANPWTLADMVNKYGFDSYEYASSSVGAGIISSVLSQSAIRLGVGATSTDSARVRTNTFYRYQAGKQQAIKITGYHETTPPANQFRRWGYFDDENGVFFATSGSSFGFYQRSSALGSTVDTFVTQSSWNIDKLDGTGVSGLNLDLRKSNIYEIHLHWLGVGNVGVFVNGHPAHKFSNANIYSGPYMTTATLPIACEVRNTAASTAGSFVFICASVEADGGQEPPRYTFNAYNTVDISVTTTEKAMLAIRPGGLYRGITNRVITLPDRLSISTEGSRAGYRIILNPTITGGIWVSASTDSSSVEYNITPTAFSGGTTIYRGFLPNSNDAKEVDLSSFFSENALRLRLNGFATNQDSLLIAGINEAAGSTLMRASLTWKEIR